VVAEAFGALSSRLAQAFSAPESIAVRVERAVEAWVGHRRRASTLARLILRHAAESDEHGEQGIFPHAGHFMKIGWALFEEGRAKGEFKRCTTIPSTPPAR
jgi:hypothetical protein